MPFHAKENRSSNTKTETVARSLSTAVEKPALKRLQLQTHQEGLRIGIHASDSALFSEARRPLRCVLFLRLSSEVLLNKHHSW